MVDDSWLVKILNAAQCNIQISVKISVSAIGWLVGVSGEPAQIDDSFKNFDIYNSNNVLNRISAILQAIHI